MPKFYSVDLRERVLQYLEDPDADWTKKGGK